MDQIKSLFGNITDVASLAQKFLEKFVTKISAWSSTQTVGEILQLMTPFLTLYTQYSINMERSTSTLNEFWDKRDQFKEFIEEVQQNPECQGIPRYRMLIEDLIKNTDDSHPDKKLLTAALSELLGVATKVNSAIVAQENSEKLWNVVKKFQDFKELDLFIPGRTFIYEGELAKVCRKDAKKRVFFLFSDIFLYATSSANSKFKIGRQFALIHVTVKDIPDAPNRGLVNAFQIKSEVKSFNVLCLSAEDKTKWLKLFNDAIEALHVKSSSLKLPSEKAEAPVWVQDSEARACKICAIKFSFTNRRHHCRQCGTIVCGSCSASKKQLAGQGKQRVCDDCYKRSDDTVSIKHTAANTGDGLSASSEESLPQAIYELDALFDYEPQIVPGAASKKLGFKQGDRLSVLFVDNSGWWLAELNSGEKGWVPSTYLEPPLEPIAS